ncbi:unnamed protein product [Hydatigera taeniaeformis]|uniref:Transposase n=1 Tax=Hydatigena taeniaeformis TaxID=6205 RepID=A0A0R3XD88_HYDTA|nr:unnamed protein product [Hydatigera taeniaeformis]
MSACPDVVAYSIVQFSHAPQNSVLSAQTWAVDVVDPQKAVYALFDANLLRTRLERRQDSTEHRVEDRWLCRSPQAESATMHTRAYQHGFVWHS